MLPNNYVVNGQPGPPQPQPQPAGPHQMSALQNQMWLRTQQQQQQQQTPNLQLMAARQGHPITQQQVYEIIRRNQSQPQPHLLGQPQHMAQQQPPQQQMSFGMQQLGANANNLYDQGLPNAHPQFGNAPGAQNFPNGLPFAAQARNPNPMQQNQRHQLDLMLNLREQNGMANPNPMAAFRQLQQNPQQLQVQRTLPQGNPQAAASNLFNTPQMIDGHNQMQAHAQAQRPRIDLQTMREKAIELREAIHNGEARIKSLQMQQVGSPNVAAEITKAQKELEARRQAYTKIVQFVQSYQNGAAAAAAPGGFANGVNMNQLALMPQQQRNIGGPQNPQQGNWMQQTAASPALQFNNSPRPGAMGAPPQQNGRVPTPQLAPNMLANQPVQRPGTTPLQHPNQPPHGVSQSPPNAMPGALANGGMGVPTNPGLNFNPLSRELFNKAYYGQWLNKFPHKDQSMLQFDGRKIDLYQLHCEVISLGAYKVVHQKDLWPVIGARLGYVHFPGTDTEPARSGPAFAAHLDHIYKEFLVDFDQQYLRQLFQHRRQLLLQQQQKHMAGPSMENGVGIGGQGLADIKDPKIVNEILSYASLSVEEMRQRGIPNAMISLVDRHRDQLKQTLETSRNFSKEIQNAQAGMQQQRNVHNPVAQQRMNNSNPMLVAQQAVRNIQNGMASLAKPGIGLGQQPQMQQGMTPANGMPPAQQQIGMNQAPGHMPINRPTPAQQQAAFEMVKRLREENKNTSANRPVNIPDAQRLEYNAIFEQLHRLVNDLDQNLPHFAVCMKEEVIKKLILMINAVQQQRELLSGQGPPKYIMPLDWVRQMILQVQQANNMFKAWLMGNVPNGVQRSGVLGPNPPQRVPSVHPPPPPPSQPTVAVPANVPAIPQPPAVQPIPPAPTPLAAASSPSAPPPARTPVAASPPIMVGTPIQKKSTPKPNAETPAHTPSHILNSPQTPKSPKPKAVPKPKPVPKPRKPSTKIAAAPPASSPSAAASDIKAPTTPATPANAPTPEASAGSKRPREEEPSTSAALAPSPAKKIKTEWDDTLGDAAAQRQAEAEAVKTDEEAIKFFEQMSSWLNQVGDGEGPDGTLGATIADSLEEILKAYPSVPDDSGLSSSFADSFTVVSSSPKHNPSTVDDFFDFTSYALLPEEESKAGTPDLVQASSSVGPSPGSASETEAHHPASTAAADTTKIVDPKSEPCEGDPIPQELWRAMDAGESAFYNASDGWKWDQPMPAVEQPWAFYQS